MLIKELGNGCFIDAPHTHATLAHPLREVGDAAHANAERARRAAAIAQVLPVRVAVRREGAFAGTPFADPGYDPFKDHDLTGTLMGVAANIMQMAATPDPYPSWSVDDVAQTDVANVKGGARFTMTQDFDFKAGPGGVHIPAGTKFAVTVSTFAGGNVLNKAALTTFHEVTVRSGPMTILSGGDPVASIEGLQLSSGGEVKVRGLKLEGKAALVGLLEIGLKAVDPATQLSGAGLSDRAAAGMAFAGQSAASTEALVRSQIEKAFTDGVKEAVLAHSGVIPGLDLALALGISGPTGGRH